MAMRAAAARGGLGRRLFSTFNFAPPPNPAAAAAPPQADPSTNLFVSGEPPEPQTLTLISFPNHFLKFILSHRFLCFLYHDLSAWLNKRTTTDGLREAFSKFGEVAHARVVTDPVHGYSKGFGFVRYTTLDGAAEGIKGMDGKFLDGWVIFAEYARPRQPRPPPGENGAPPSPRY
ncbi:hypothetical protein Syun_010315 [Stephania yunnanensis]|uniref:RRM domain-containing protein n=1 Tax=Stephania yunnanensis TaxID=152371 RepID=A0AAP0PT53_9MAGN